MVSCLVPGSPWQSVLLTLTSWFNDFRQRNFSIPMMRLMLLYRALKAKITFLLLIYICPFFILFYCMHNLYQAINSHFFSFLYRVLIKYCVFKMYSRQKEKTQYLINFLYIIFWLDWWIDDGQSGVNKTAVGEMQQLADNITR